MAERPSSARTDGGSAVVDFALVGGLLTMVFLAIAQLALLLHVRNTLTDCAAEAARYGARADRSPADATVRAQGLIVEELPSGYAARVFGLDAHEIEVGGVREVEVTARAPAPVVGLFGPGGLLTVRGHAFVEGQ